MRWSLPEWQEFADWLAGFCPDLDVAFENEEDREVARNFMDLLAASEDDSGS